MPEPDFSATFSTATPSALLVQQLAARLGQLSITDPKTGQTIATPLLGYHNPAPQHAAQIAEMASIHAQAIIEEIGRLGHTILPTAEYDELRAAANSSEHHRNTTIEAICQCGTTIFKARASGYDHTRPIVNGPAIITAIARMSTDCALNHQVAT